VDSDGREGSTAGAEDSSPAYMQGRAGRLARAPGVAGRTLCMAQQPSPAHTQQTADSSGATLTLLLLGAAAVVPTCIPYLAVMSSFLFQNQRIPPPGQQAPTTAARLYNNIIQSAAAHVRQLLPRHKQY
jgi:hypothetical protein